MKLLKQKDIELFYGYFVVNEAQKLEAEGKKQIPTEELVCRMLSDLLEVSQRVVGIDGKIAREEVDAINELFEVAGYRTNWFKLKAEAPVTPPRFHTSDILKDFADAQLEVCTLSKQYSPEEALERIETFLFLWCTFMCEVIIADREFTEVERDLVLSYVGEFCKYVTLMFRRPFLISDDVKNVFERAIKECYHQ